MGINTLRIYFKNSSEDVVTDIIDELKKRKGTKSVSRGSKDGYEYIEINRTSKSGMSSGTAVKSEFDGSDNINDVVNDIINMIDNMC